MVIQILVNIYNSHHPTTSFSLITLIMPPDSARISPGWETNGVKLHYTPSSVVMTHYLCRCLTSGKFLVWLYRLWIGFWVQQEGISQTFQETWSESLEYMNIICIEVTEPEVPPSNSLFCKRVLKCYFKFTTELLQSNTTHVTKTET